MAIAAMKRNTGNGLSSGVAARLTLIGSHKALTPNNENGTTMKTAHQREFKRFSMREPNFHNQTDIPSEKGKAVPTVPHRR